MHSMSFIMIIFLILILSFYFCDGKNFDKVNGQDELGDSEDEKFSFVSQDFNDLSSNSVQSPSGDHHSKLINEKLRKYLQRRLQILVKKIIKKRRSRENQKWEDHKKFVNNVEEISVGNNLDDEKLERHSEDYISVIRQNYSPIGYPRVIPKISGLAKVQTLTKIPKVESNLTNIGPRFDLLYENDVAVGKRDKRATDNEPWIKQDFRDRHDDFRMYALIVKDEDIPPCCSPAKRVTNRRYFMCSGALMTLKHAITTASCMHFADIHKHEIKADLGVLIDATNPRYPSLVIKINRYEMHPQYKYDVDSPDHAKHNLAIIFLNCRLNAGQMRLPRFPRGINDDVAHLCCRESCHLFTVVQRYNNRHNVRVMRPRNLPAPRHHEDESSLHGDLNLDQNGNGHNGDNHNGINGDNQNGQNGGNYNGHNGGNNNGQNGGNYNGHNGNNDPDSTRVSRLINKRFPMVNRSKLTRNVRSPAKLAAAPIFFRKKIGESSNRTNEKSSGNDRKRKKLKISEISNGQQRSLKKNDLLPFSDFANEDDQVPAFRAMDDEGLSVKDQLAAIDWSKIEETMSKKLSSDNREAMDLFAKRVVDETMRRLEKVVGDDEKIDNDYRTNEPQAANLRSRSRIDEILGKKPRNGSAIFAKLMPPMKKNQTINSFVKVFTKVITNLIPLNDSTEDTGSADNYLDQSDLPNPPPIYDRCPPLGTPVFSDRILVGFVAYTCDDAQEWVSWKYVNTATSMKWLRDKMLERWEPPGRCDGRSGPSANARSLQNGSMSYIEDISQEFESQGKIGSYDPEWARNEREIERMRNGDETKNFHDFRIPATETSLGTFKDSWTARNSRFAPYPHRQRSPDRPKISPNLPVYNFHTCYVKDDGTTECETKTEYTIH